MVLTMPPPKRGTAYPKETKQLALSLYLQGVSREHISRQTGIPVPTVSKWILRGGWCQHRDTALEVLTSNGNQTAIVTVNKDLIARSNALRGTLAGECEAQAGLLKDSPPERVSELAGRNGRASVLKTIVESAATIFDWSSQSDMGLVAMGDMDSALADQPSIDVSASVEPSANPTAIPDAPCPGADTSAGASVPGATDQPDSK